MLLLPRNKATLHRSHATSVASALGDLFFPAAEPLLANGPQRAQSPPMKITEAVLKYATAQAISEEEALQRWMEEKQKEFVEAGADF